MTEAAKNHLWKAEEYHFNSTAQYDAAIELMKRLRLEGNERVLDVGCGDGKISAKIAKQIPLGSVIGIDVSSEMIDYAQKAFPKKDHDNLTFFLQDAQQLDDYEDLDIIFSSFALQWINPCLFFKHAFKSLKPFGYLVATIPLGISSALQESIDAIIALPAWASYFHSFSPGWNFLPYYEYKQLLEAQKFILMSFTIVQQKVMFSSREAFEKYVIQWFSYLSVLPKHLKMTFFKLIIDAYLEINPVQVNGEIIFSFPRIDFIANKSIP